MVPWAVRDPPSLQTTRIHPRLIARPGGHAPGVEDFATPPFRQALGRLLLGSEEFVSRIKQFADQSPDDREVPNLRRLKSRTTISDVLAAVADHFGRDETAWLVGSRSDDAGRAVAAYLARVRFGYSAKSVGAALNYRDSRGVRHAVKRIEAGTKKLHAVINRLDKKLR